MSRDRWIVVRGWERFQHRDAARTDVPPWIKLHTRLLSDEAFLDLSVGRRLLLVMLWLEYARTRRRLPDDTRSLSRRLGQRVVSRDLEALQRAGFLTFSDSEPARIPDSEPDSLEVEVEVEGPLYPAQSAGNAGRNGPATGRPTTPCEVCGEPVPAWSRCPNCGANPRAAGSSSRQTATRATRGTVFERACTKVRNELWQYDLDTFREELDRFDLTDDDRAQLERMRDALIDEQAALDW